MSSGVQFLATQKSVKLEEAVRTLNCLVFFFFKVNPGCESVSETRTIKGKILPCDLADEGTKYIKLLLVWCILER